jgi:hypothetical protein
MLPAQTVLHATGIAHTEQIDLAYETFGAKGTALPIIAVNGRVPRVSLHTVGAPSFRGVCERVGSMLFALHL